MTEAVLSRASAWRLMRPSNATLLLCAVGVVLPNALSLGALALGIGVPPRPAVIMAYATLALLARLVHPLVTVAACIAIAIYDAISTVALLFNLAPSEIGLALRLGGDLNILKSPLYIGLAAGSLAILLGNMALLTLMRPTLRRGNPLAMMGFALAFMVADFATNTSPHYHFGTLFGAGKPMESAAASSGFRAAVLAGNGRPVLLVIVEALGRFNDPAHRAILSAPLRSPALLERYDLSTGSTTYYGSTTAAEMRELCDSREPYQAVIDGKNIPCLPKQMSERGYRSVSLHHFGARFFDRELWYPKLGFERSLFRNDLGDVPFKLCGGPFRGPCDTDMIPVIAKQLGEPGRSTFLYWLTLSTHVPIAPKEGTPRLACERDGGRFGHAEVCFMTEMWMDVFEALAGMAAKMPPMEILIVGDHAPPLWSKSGRHLFDPGKVPWFRLRPRIAAPATTH